MAEVTRAVSWEAPEHHHVEKSSDWYWVLGILAVAGASASIIFGNMLFGIVILLGAATTALVSHREPKVLPFGVSQRGIQVGSTLYPYSTLESFCLSHQNPTGPQLILKSKHFFMPLIIIPVPDEYADDIDTIVATRIPEEHLEEPISHRLLEIFGF